MPPVRRSESSPRVLLVPSFYFPPHGQVRVLRTVKFCKWLPANGWAPWVLTVDPRYYDPGTLLQSDGAEWRGARVFRIPFVDVPASRVLIKVLFPLLTALFALRCRSRLTAAYMSGSPFYPFPLTFVFARLLRLPSVIDFRDSWSFNHGFDGRRPDGVWGRLRERVFGMVERFSIKYASRVLFATPILEEEYANLFPEYRHKYVTILNGFDPDDVAGIGANRVSPRTTLVLAGQFSRYVPHAVDGLMACLRHNGQLHFLYLGEEHELFANKAQQYDVAGQVTTLPRVSYREALEFISGSDVALLATGLVNGVGTKIYDYLALDKPVLCLVPQGSNIARMFGDLPRVVISHPPHSVSRLIEALEQTIKCRNLPARPGAMAEFTRPAAAARLAGLLNELCPTS